MSHSHIVSSFETELKDLEKLVAEMGGLAEQQLIDAVDALVKRDADRAMDVKRADKKIDALEEAIDDHAVKMLALRQPMADDLRAVIVALKTASIIERTGDYAKNIAKRTVVLAGCPPIDSVRTVRRMADLVQVMIKDVLDAYVTHNADLALAVRDRDEEIDALHTSLFRELLTYMLEDPRNITACTHLMFVAKNVERIGDHATNIGENVYFLVHGKRLEDERPKGDKSAYVTEPALPVVSS